MPPANSLSLVFFDSKSHYKILDGLRGVAAVMVVGFHIFEAFSGGSHIKQIMNHGYLAVDFFFVLSGFVIGYAYDDRWKSMSLGGFFKRRLIRIHPMIIMGMIIGAITFYSQASGLFPLINDVPVWQMILVMLVGFTLLPIPPSMDIRGWNEMHPLDGPAWSLFYEYIANILYALFVRKFSNKILSVFVFFAGCALIHLAVTSRHGDIIGGWSFNTTQIRIGLTRLIYPFFAGLLLSRVCRPGRIKNAFFICVLIIVAILSMPRIGGSTHLWMNGLYDSLVVIFIFPLVVFIGASGDLKGEYANGICKFFGDISYPIYIIHYPLIYIFTAWVVDNKVSLPEAGPVALLVLLLAIILSYLLLKIYDLPLRKWLVTIFITKKP